MEEVVNPYRRAIKRTWDSSTDTADRLRQVLNGAVPQLQEAWQGGISQHVIDQLQYLSDEAYRASRDALDTFQSAWEDQPSMVDEDAWQTRWQNLGPR